MSILRREKNELPTMWQRIFWVPFRVSVGDWLALVADKIRGFSRDNQ